MQTDDLERSFGQVIRVHRESRRLSQEAFAEECGLHRTYISQLEHGRKSPTLRVIARLALALEVRADELLKQALNEALQNV
jgi:transcriptional regulator with XRE-family HTH domain